MRCRATRVDGSLENMISPLFFTHSVKYAAPLSWYMKIIPHLASIFPTYLANGCWMLELGAILIIYDKWNLAQARDVGVLPLNLKGHIGKILAEVSRCVALAPRW